MSFDNLFKSINQVAKSATDTINIARDLEEGTRYDVLNCKRFAGPYGTGVLVEFRENAQPEEIPKKMWLPKRIAKIFVDSDEKFDQFASKVSHFYYLGMDGRSAKFRFEFAH